MAATFWHILSKKHLQWPETGIKWICWNLIWKTRGIDWLYLWLQHFDTFCVKSTCNDRKRKSSEYSLDFRFRSLQVLLTQNVSKCCSHKYNQSIPRVFQIKFQQIHLIPVSGHCKCFLLKMCQNVAAITNQFYKFFKSSFSKFTWFPFPVIANAFYSKYVKILQP